MSSSGVGSTTTTTIYFPLTANVSPVIPIVPSPPPPQIYPMQQDPTAVTTSTFNSCSDSGDNCHQNQHQFNNHSLVKYHTIHLQHPKDYATIHGTILIPTPQQQQPQQHHTATIHGELAFTTLCELSYVLIVIGC